MADKHGADQLGTASDEQPFVSELPHGRERFLAHVIEHGLEIGRRAPEDFLRHFPPQAIMSGLRDRPSLRAAILVESTGIKNRIALKKSHQSAGEDLQIALDERETNAATVVRLFRPDDRVRYLDHKALWTFVVEGDFWNADAKKRSEIDRARQHIAYMLDRALVDELLTHRDIVEGIEVAEIARLLPRDQLSRLIFGSLDNAREGKPFNEVDMLRMVPTSTLVEHIPLPWIWERVVVPRIAVAHGFVPREEPRAKQSSNAAESKRSASESETGEAASMEPPRAEPTKRAQTKAESVNAEPVTAEPAKAEPVKAEPAKAEPVRAEQLQAKSKPAERVEPAPKIETLERTSAQEPSDAKEKDKSARSPMASASAFASPNASARSAPKRELAKTSADETNGKRPSIPIDMSDMDSDLPDDQTNPLANIEDIARARTGR